MAHVSLGLGLGDLAVLVAYKYSCVVFTVALPLVPAHDHAVGTLQHGPII